ncbi:hypothetical protein CISIN_1g006991mg [Citrus sinensis]|uniref:Uncharacterized protein n=1 Tax=Citrus sinensis TaxID=2711 RepID=A0A067ETQ9_CITSI|nr:hypothetical protein CISIN_1g006991mg [Citrus sinensis]
MVPKFKPSPLRIRSFCTKTVQQNPHHWPIKQITKTNFNESLSEIKNHISSSDFIAVSLQNTGSFSSPWHRVSTFDTPETAYLKAKFAAERFQILQFAICPFKLQASKVIAYPYNFHLFPRDELKMGMPSYSFTCQTSYLTAMAKEGFDFNTCIYDGISYLSEAQESTVKVRMGNPMAVDHATKSSSSPALSVADTVFIERVRSRVKHWKNACTDSDIKTEALVTSLRKIVLGGEQFGSRPSMTIDVCSERQVQLVLKMLEDFSDVLVPLIIPAKGGGTQAVRAVLTSSDEDKDLLKRELQTFEFEQNKRVRGFREVIDLISASQKPLVAHNSLNDFTFIHSKFLAPLPPNMNEFICSLRLAFPQVIDVNYLLKDIGPVKKMTNISATIAYLKNRFFAPIEMEIPNQANENEGKIHGHNVVKICQLFGKLCSILKITPDAIESSDDFLASAINRYANIFYSLPGSSQEPTNEEIRGWTNDKRKVSCEDVVFLWGFRERISAGILKNMLQGSHEVFAEAFNVRMVDRSCAIVVFGKPGLSNTFKNVMNSKAVSGPLREMVSDGLKAAGYETYQRVCSSGLWESALADALDKTLASHNCLSEAAYETKQSEIYLSNELINLAEL